jgi:hypothetical protein
VAAVKRRVNVRSGRPERFTTSSTVPASANRSALVHAGEPFHQRRIASGAPLAARHEKRRHDDNVAARHLVHGFVDLERDSSCRAQRTPRLADDFDVEVLVIGRRGVHHFQRAQRAEHVVQAAHGRGHRLGDRDQAYAAAHALLSP